METKFTPITPSVDKTDYFIEYEDGDNAEPRELRE
jgi:hypothetical protein